MLRLEMTEETPRRGVHFFRDWFTASGQTLARVAPFRWAEARFSDRPVGAGVRTMEGCSSKTGAETCRGQARP